MTTKSYLARSAGSAIAAALVLGPSPLLAQEAAAPAAPAQTEAIAPEPGPSLPVLVSPVAPQQSPAPAQQVPVPTAADLPGGAAGQASSPPSPAPAPGTSPSNIVTTSNPVVQEIPEQPEQAAASPAGNSEARVAQANEPASAPAATPAPANESVTTIEEPPLPIAEEAADEPLFVAPQPFIEPLPESVPQADGTANDVGLIAGAISLLALLVLGLLVFLGLRRRRAVVAVPRVERPMVKPTAKSREPLKSIAATVPDEAAPEKRPERDIRDWALPLSARQDPPQSQLREGEGGLPHAGAAIALPRKAPAALEERKALLDRMVAAQPDRANPFRSRKARRHRARLILQSLGRKFENGTSNIDFSQYPMNWPELARRDLPNVA